MIRCIHNGIMPLDSIDCRLFRNTTTKSKKDPSKNMQDQL